MSGIIGRIYLAAAFTIAGSSVVSIKYLAGFLGPFTIISAGLFISIICAGPFCLKNIGQALIIMNRQAWLMLIMQAAFGIFMFRVLLLAGLNYTTAGEAGLLTGATPAITALLAYTILKEPLSLKSILGIMLTVAGIMILNGAGPANFSQHLLGNFLVLGAAASESIFNVCSRKSGLDQSTAAIHPLSRTVMVCTLALMACLIPACFEQPLTMLRNLNVYGWLSLGWQGIFVTIASYAFWFAGIKRCDAYTAAAFSGLMPLAAVIFAVIFLNEQMTAGKITGGLWIIAGMAVLGARSRRQVKQTAV